MQNTYNTVTHRKDNSEKKEANEICKKEKYQQ